MKIVRCPDAIAIVANLSKHLRYISSSVIYIKDHLKRSTDFLKDSQVSRGARCSASAVRGILDHLKCSTDFLKDSQVSSGAHCCC